jgi:hypothetical protein
MKYQMRILQGLKLAAVLAVALSMGACANKNIGADGAMASAAAPGSQQDFVVNVGDRVFFESDQTELSPQAMPTSAAPANTTSRWARGVHNRCAPSLPRAASTPRGCGRSLMARNARLRSATTSPAGPRIAVRLRC